MRASSLAGSDGRCRGVGSGQGRSPRCVGSCHWADSGVYRRVYSRSCWRKSGGRRASTLTRGNGRCRGVGRGQSRSSGCVGSCHWTHCCIHRSVYCSCRIRIERLTSKSRGHKAQQSNLSIHDAGNECCRDVNEGSRDSQSECTERV